MAIEKSTTVRVVLTALALCALSFVVGVVGDLSLASPPRGPAVTIVIPPDAIRAGPLPPLPRTESARAGELERSARLIRVAQSVLREKPPLPRAKGVQKPDPDFAPKAESVKH